MEVQQIVNRIYSKSMNTNGKSNTTIPDTTSTQHLNKYSAHGLRDSELVVKTVSDYLSSLPKETLEHLYSYPSICFAVYRELTEMARQCVIRLLFVPHPVPVGITWNSQHYSGEQSSVDKQLSDMQVWRQTAMPGGLPAWELSPNFRRNLKSVLIGGGTPWCVAAPPSTDPGKWRDIAFLDKYSMARWRGVLHFLVGLNHDASCTDVEGISPDAARVLIKAQLLRRDEEKKGVVLTQRGFQFLLMDTQTQVWHFILQYLETCDELELSVPECLSLLFQLSCCTLGREYSTEGFSSKLLIFLQHLREFGLVFQRKRKEARFYPTRLGIAMTSRGESVYSVNVPTVMSDYKSSDRDTVQSDNPIIMDMEAIRKGFIIVETNYRVYAHTNSKLHIAVLALFTELIYRLPNFAVGIITRESVRQSLYVGITANQIVQYLERYAHPAMRKLSRLNKIKSVLPPALVDQIYLWEHERNRIKYTEGIIYNHFLSQVDFNTLRDFAQNIDAILWENERLRTMVINKAGHEEVKRYWKKYSKSAI